MEARVFWNIPKPTKNCFMSTKVWLSPKSPQETGVSGTGEQGEMLEYKKLLSPIT